MREMTHTASIARSPLFPTIPCEMMMHSDRSLLFLPRSRFPYATFTVCLLGPPRFSRPLYLRPVPQAISVAVSS